MRPQRALPSTTYPGCYYGGGRGEGSREQGDGIGMCYNGYGGGDGHGSGYGSCYGDGPGDGDGDGRGKSTEKLVQNYRSTV